MSFYSDAAVVYYPSHSYVSSMDSVINVLRVLSLSHRVYDANKTCSICNYLYTEITYILGILKHISRK